MANGETAVMRKMIGVCRLHRKLCDRETELNNIHRSQSAMLMFISRQSEPVSQVEIAEKLEVSTAAASVMIKKLVANGYVKKSLREGDSRKNNIEITPKGFETVSKTHEIFSNIDMRVFEKFTAGELEVFSTLLQKAEDEIKKIIKEEKV